LGSKEEQNMPTYKTALITGAAGDIGANVAKRLHLLGYRLILLDIDETNLKNLSRELPNSSYKVLDLTDREALDEFNTELAMGEIRIELAFINAGAIAVGNAIDIEDRMIDLQLEVNLRSAIHLIKSCARNMVKHGGGHIISTVSMGGIVALKGSATYSAAKFGLRGFMTGIRDELAPHGVTVSGIYPSGVDTKMLRYEALNGGSNLNFVSEPLSVDDVGKAVIKTITSKKLEVYLPFSEGVSGRFVSVFLWMIRYLYPLMERIGERGLRKYLNKLKTA
jgi:short-subunit dehydrogenase